jgi:hypothetical protein
VARFGDRANQVRWGKWHLSGRMSNQFSGSPASRDEQSLDPKAATIRTAIAIIIPNDCGLSRVEKCRCDCKVINPREKPSDFASRNPRELNLTTSLKQQPSDQRRFGLLTKRAATHSSRVNLGSFRTEK